LSRFSDVRKPPVAKVRNRHSARRAKKTPASRAHKSCDRLNDPRVGARAPLRTTSTIRIHSRFQTLGDVLSLAASGSRDALHQAGSRLLLRNEPAGTFRSGSKLPYSRTRLKGAFSTAL